MAVEVESPVKKGWSLFDDAAGNTRSKVIGITAYWWG